MPHGQSYTADEDQHIIDSYSTMTLGAIGQQIGRTVESVRVRSHALRDRGLLDPATRYYAPLWTRYDDTRLAEMIGAGLSLAQIAKRLGRSVGGIRARKQGQKLRYRKGRYTLHSLAALMGVESHAPAWWHREGWLRAQRSRLRSGQGCMTFISHDDLAEFLEDERYWHVWQPDRITDSVWREWTTELRAGVRFLTTREAGEVLCLTHYGVNVAIREGRLKAVKHGPNWLVRSDQCLLLERPRRPKRPSTAEDIEYVRQHWDALPATEIAARRGMTESAVLKIARRLGLPLRGRGWWRRERAS